MAGEINCLWASVPVSLAAGTKDWCSEGTSAKGTVIFVVFLAVYMTRLFLFHRDLRLRDTEFSVKMITY